MLIYFALRDFINALLLTYVDGVYLKHELKERSILYLSYLQNPATYEDVSTKRKTVMIKVSLISKYPLSLRIRRSMEACSSSVVKRRSTTIKKKKHSVMGFVHALYN